MPTLLSFKKLFKPFSNQTTRNFKQAFFPQPRLNWEIRSNFIDFLLFSSAKTFVTSSTNRSLMFPEMQLDVTNA